MVIIPGIGCEIDFSKELLLMVLEFSDHFVSLYCLDVVFDFSGEVEIILEQPARKNVPAALRNYSSEVERITLLLEGQDLDSRESIMAPPRFQCLNAVRSVLMKGSGLRAAFSTSRTTRAGSSTFFSKQQHF